MLHLALKAFYPGRPPFPLMHVDTTWKFKEMIEFRDQQIKKLDLDMIVHINEEGVAAGVGPFTHGSEKHTDIMKTQALKKALDKYRFDAAFGGARRDEEKSRANERVFYFRDKNPVWDPKTQRPELWNIFNGKVKKGESIRVFPLSNWTELDIWQYIYLNNIDIVPLYFAKPRPIVHLDGVDILVDDDRIPIEKEQKIETKTVRFRTLGCYPLTGAVESTATTLPEIIQEMLLTTSSERQGRLIDTDRIGSMEEKKRKGYFQLIMSHQSELISTDINTYLAQHERKELLRLLTCGSVDDGKSTLIGRLLHDSKMIYEDQLAAIEADLSLIHI